MHQQRTIRARIIQAEPLQVVTLSCDEYNIIQRLRDMKAKRCQLVVIEIGPERLFCREVGRREG